MTDIIFTLIRVFFVKDNFNHLLVLHPNKDVLVDDVKDILTKFNLDDYIIENVYMPVYDKHVVKIYW